MTKKVNASKSIVGKADLKFKKYLCLYRIIECDRPKGTYVEPGRYYYQHIYDT